MTSNQAAPITNATNPASQAGTVLRESPDFSKAKLRTRYATTISNAIKAKPSASSATGGWYGAACNLGRACWVQPYQARRLPRRNTTAEIMMPRKRNQVCFACLGKNNSVTLTGVVLSQAGKADLVAL